MCIEFDVHTGFVPGYSIPRVLLEHRNVRRAKSRENIIHTYRENIAILMVSAR